MESRVVGGGEEEEEEKGEEEEEIGPCRREGELEETTGRRWRRRADLMASTDSVKVNR